MLRTGLDVIRSFVFSEKLFYLFFHHFDGPSGHPFPETSFTYMLERRCQAVRPDVIVNIERRCIDLGFLVDPISDD